MLNDYNAVVGLTKEEYDKATFPDDKLNDPKQFVKSDANDLAKIELLLDVKAGLLASGEYYFENYVCKNCQRQLSTYDFVFTGLVDAGHSKSFILHTLVGNKYIINKARITKCSKCGTKTDIKCSYSMTGGGSHYSCGTALPV